MLISLRLRTPGENRRLKDGEGCSKMLSFDLDIVVENVDSQQLWLLMQDLQKTGPIKTTVHNGWGFHEVLLL